MNTPEDLQNRLFRNGSEHLRFSEDFVTLAVKFDIDMISFVSFIDREVRFSVGKKYYDF